MNVVRIGNIINGLAIGDRVTINDWEYPFTVIATSQNYAVAYHRATDEYSIISKQLADFTYNSVQAGTYYCGPDNFVFSQFDRDNIFAYIGKLEDPSNELKISRRKSVTIHSITVSP